ncbi:MAG: zf-HC2 domain-containing protein [Acidobacteriia bacterium]|nr:zf-HC2 domain-containing protein [Terriglobia bacterium]
MNCEKVRKTLSAFLDSNLAPKRFDTMTQHLAQCRDCSSYAKELGDLHSALRSLPAVEPPALLGTELQVLASRERMRQLSRGTYTALFHFRMAEMHLFFDNLMRPIAIPFAGGLVSAVFLFTMLMPTLQFPHLTRNDVPSGLFTQSVATVDTLPPFGFSGDNFVVQVMLDEQGYVVDYKLPDNVSSKLRNDIANMILFTKFEPATAYGVPIAAKVVVSFRRIDVKG